MTLCALFEHLQAHEMHIKGKGLIFKGEDMRANLTGDADQKGDAKRDKSLASTVSQNEISKIDETMKKENHNSATSSSNVCYKCDQPGHSIRDFSINKDDHGEYVKSGESKDKEGDLVRPKLSRT
ncbi:hypothetical protein KY290_031782 [Solanum tuberosum]|uniref:CCHC-type domain-containing protein n=1 Tax=Solanum tuberosum TaxID=4113 RepID=A0ABQ7UAV7_SOLTU|nr:hypothetical protein KY289_031179 [Solanum tuberosum]KAH0743789.1 hypothetical protein KY290_031782 [Solanum tuberosum]